MNRLKKFIHNYLNFSRRERRGLIVLWILIVLAWEAPDIVRKIHAAPPPVDFSQAQQIARMLDSTSTIPQKYFRDSEKMLAQALPEKHDTLFDFDPNTLSAGQWEQLGVPNHIITIIQHYLAKGGHFYKKEDLQKIYGLSAKDYRRLAPYVQIGGNDQNHSNLQYDSAKKEKAVTNTDEYERLKIELNSADTTRLKLLRGIGSVFSKRIVHFREKLGGFYSIDQLEEVYNLQDSVINQIRPHLIVDTTLVQKININTADRETLQQHPYISYHLANAIVNYREQHGDFTDVKQLRHIALVNDQIYRKIVHYLVVN